MFKEVGMAVPKSIQTSVRMIEINQDSTHNGRQQYYYNTIIIITLIVR